MLPGDCLTDTDRLKKGSVPTLYPASKEPKNRYSIGGSGISAISGIGFAGGGGGGGGSGNNSPPNTNNDNDSLIMPMSTKRPLLSQPSAQQPVAKQRRSLPPTLGTSTNNNHAAAVSGVLAGLIQRQQLKEQQRKAFAAALQLQQRHHHQQQQQQVQPNPQRSLLASLKQKPNTTTTTNHNNNNNHISSNNNNNNSSSAKLAAATLQERLEDERGYGINYVDMDGGGKSDAKKRILTLFYCSASSPGVGINSLVLGNGNAFKIIDTMRLHDRVVWLKDGVVNYRSCLNFGTRTYFPRTMSNSLESSKNAHSSLRKTTMMACP